MINNKASTEQPRHLTFLERLQFKKRTWCILGGAVGVLVLLLIIIIAVTVSGGGSDDGSNDKWKSNTPNTNLQAVTHVQFTGTWDDRLVVAGTASASASSIEIYDLDDSNDWIETKSFSIDGRIASMAVSDSGMRIAVALQDDASGTEGSVRFAVYSETMGGTWNQYGNVIEPNELLASTGSDTSSVSGFQDPTVMLSSDGKTMVITLQPAGSSTLQHKIHVLRDVNSLDGTIGGGMWIPLGQPILDAHVQDHGSFATFTALSGDGKKLVIASEHEMLAVYELEEGELGEEDIWRLRVEYDESPRVEPLGSLSLSRDGSTLAVGSYESLREGAGEVHIVNPVWPWFLVNREDEDGGAAVDDESLATTAIQVSLSESGDRVLVGRFPIVEGPTSLQVYEYSFDKVEWVSLGAAFGDHLDLSGASSVMMNGAAVDLSDDAQHVAAAVDGELLVYAYTG